MQLYHIIFCVGLNMKHVYFEQHVDAVSVLSPKVTTLIHLSFIYKEYIPKTCQIHKYVNANIKQSTQKTFPQKHYAFTPAFSLCWQHRGELLILCLCVSSGFPTLVRQAGLDRRVVILTLTTCCCIFGKYPPWICVHKSIFLQVQQILVAFTLFKPVIFLSR